MPKGKQVILNNLDEFAEKVVNLIADESEGGRERLIALINNAKARYSSAIESRVQGWVYQFTRLRVPEVSKAVEKISTKESGSAEVYYRLKKIKSLISTGEWNQGSYNYELFVELINAIPGYKTVDPAALKLTIDSLHPLVLEKIQVFIDNYKSAKKAIEQKNQELSQAQQKTQSELEQIDIQLELNPAKIMAVQLKSDAVFCITHLGSDETPKVSWIDPRGCEHALENSKELTALLKNKSKYDVQTMQARQTQRVKKELYKMKEHFLDKTHVLVNPYDETIKANASNELLMENGVHATFVVRGQADAFKLWWINSIGIAHELSLDAHSPLLAWLNTHEPDDPDQIMQLKMHLLHVNTAKGLGPEQLKAQQTLDRVLLQRSRTASSETAPETSTKKPPNRLNMGDYAEVSSLFAARLQQTRGKKPEPSKVDVTAYPAVATLFAHKAKQVKTADEKSVTHSL